VFWGGCGLGFLFVFWFVFLVWGWGRLQVASFGVFLRFLVCFAVFCGWFVFMNLVLQVVGVGGGAMPLTEKVMFNTPFQKAGKLQIPKLIRWRFKHWEIK
jgi:hypothetical protein